MVRVHAALAWIVLALAAACLGLHVLIVAADPSPISFVMLGLAAFCGYCAWHLRRHAASRAWSGMVMANAVMIVLHLVGGPGRVLIGTTDPGPAHGHSPEGLLLGAEVVPHTAALGLLGELALAVALAELVLTAAALIAFARTRRRSGPSRA